MYTLGAVFCTRNHARIALDGPILPDDLAGKNARPDTDFLLINTFDVIGTTIALQSKSILQLLGKLFVIVPPSKILRWIFAALW